MPFRVKESPQAYSTLRLAAGPETEMTVVCGKWERCEGHAQARLLLRQNSLRKLWVVRMRRSSKRSDLICLLFGTLQSSRPIRSRAIGMVNRYPGNYLPVA